MNNISCHICGSADISQMFKLHPDVVQCRCVDCRAQVLSPQPSDGLLAKQYESYFTRRGDGDFSKKDYFKWFLKQLNPDLVPNKQSRILDIGAGEGYMLRALREKFPEATLFGLEPAWKESIKEAVNDIPVTKLSYYVEEWLSQKDGLQFDAMFACDVIEHVRDPLQVIKQLVSEHLDKNGVIVAAFPSSESFGAAMFRKLWPQYKIEHITLFSRKSLEKIAADAGLEVIMLEPHHKCLPLGYFLQVGRNFGHPLVQAMSKVITSLVPKSLLTRSLTLSLGEWVWIARKK